MTFDVAKSVADCVIQTYHKLPLSSILRVDGWNLPYVTESKREGTFPAYCSSQVFRWLSRNSRYELEAWYLKPRVTTAFGTHSIPAHPLSFQNLHSRCQRIQLQSSSTPTTPRLSDATMTVVSGIYTKIYLGRQASSTYPHVRSGRR